MDHTIPLYVQAKDHLKALIKDMSPGEKLPSRKALCQELQIAKITIDRAISELIGEGYLYTLNGSGTYVADKQTSSTDEPTSITWGIVVPNSENFLFPQLINGLSDVAAQYDINLILCNTDDDCRSEETYISSLIRSRVNGVIIVPSVNESVTQLDAYRSLENAKIPFVLCNRDVRGINAHVIKSNHYYGTYIAVKHLLDHGHRNIAFVSQKRYSIVEERYSGYIAAFEEAAVPIDPQFIYMHDTYDEKSAAVSAAQKLFALEKRPSAVFCFNDLIASVVYDQMTHAGIHIPNDLAIVSCDNTLLCELLPCKLTSVDGSSYQVGYEAAMQLLQLCGLAAAPAFSPYTLGNYTVLPQKIVIRESCGCHPESSGLCTKE